MERPVERKFDVLNKLLQFVLWTNNPCKIKRTEDPQHNTRTRTSHRSIGYFVISLTVNAALRTKNYLFSVSISAFALLL